MDGSPLTAVVIMGINRPSNCSPRFIANCLYHEFGFPLTEMFTTSTGPKLIVPALAGSSVELYAKFDPTLPLTPGLSIENARSFFNHRITSSINRIKTCPKPRACLDSSILWKPADLLIASKLSLYNQPQSNIGDLSTGKV